ncbi:hypothetical protein KDA11_05175, partial [Candidatus Saccharibacteria bacterium]|nr:hypothetical protein [Candidatus Saccharibacteria bacterium]
YYISIYITNITLLTITSCYIIITNLINHITIGAVFSMGKPKKRTTPRRTGTRRSHLVLKLARAVNGKSPVKAFTTRRESSKSASK